MNQNQNQTQRDQEHDDLELLVASSFDQHARIGGTDRATGNLDGVFDRVSRRRNRSRMTAGVGAMVIIAAGVAGIFALTGGSGRDELADSNAGAPSAPMTSSGFTWQCTAPVTASDGTMLFDGCQIIPMVDDPVWQCVDPVASVDQDEIVSYQSASCSVVAAYEELPGVDVTATSVALPIAIDPVAVPTVSVPTVGVPCVNDPLLPTMTTIELSSLDVDQPALPTPTTSATPIAPTASTDTPNCFDVSPTTTSIWPAMSSMPPLPSSPDEQTYTIVAGDNPSRVAAMFGVTVEQLQEYNADTDILQTFIVGQSVKIPPGAIDRPNGTASLYVVRSGDTLFGIAEDFGVTLDQLAEYNGISGAFLLVPDHTVLNIPPAHSQTVATILSTTAP